jgi:uncharacterized protein YggE
MNISFISFFKNNKLIFLFIIFISLKYSNLTKSKSEIKSNSKIKSKLNTKSKTVSAVISESDLRFEKQFQIKGEYPKKPYPSFLEMNLENQNLNFLKLNKNKNKQEYNYPFPNSNQDNNIRSGYKDREQEAIIKIKGEASIYLKSDLIKIGISIEDLRPTAQNALQVNSLTTNEVTKALKEINVNEDEISTLNYSIEPKYILTADPTNPKENIKKFDGFMVSNLLEVTCTKVNFAGQIIDKSLSSGAKKISYVKFDILKETLKKAKNELLGKAFEDSLSKVNNIISPIGYMILKVNSLRIGNYCEEKVRRYEKIEDIKAPEKFLNFNNNSRKISLEIDVSYIIIKKEN